MKRIRRSADRGYGDYDWLKTAHTFSFGAYDDPEHRGYRSLRVLNEDRVAGGGGFPQHGHRDMEIITYVISGALEHRDTLGTSSVIRPGELQRMSAGAGIEHSEFNHYPDVETHFYQIWILPSEHGIRPSYEQVSLDQKLKTEGWALAASPDGAEGSVRIRQDARIWIGRLGVGERRALSWEQNRGAWLQVVRGEIALPADDIRLASSDGLAVEGKPEIEIEALGEAEFLFFDLA